LVSVACGTSFGDLVFGLLIAWSKVALW